MIQTGTLKEVTSISFISCVLGSCLLYHNRLLEFLFSIRLIWLIIDWEQIGFGFKLHRFFSKVNYVKLGLRLLMISSRSLNVHGISVYKKRRSLSLNSPYSSFFVNDLDWHTLKEVTVQAHCVLGSHRLCLNRLPEFFILIRLIWIIIDWEQNGFWRKTKKLEIISSLR